MDYYLERLTQPLFAQHLWTDELSVAEVAEWVADSAGLALLPNTDTELRAAFWRARVTFATCALADRPAASANDYSTAVGPSNSMVFTPLVRR